jgi:tRNA 5-methylaminomethyl-2-thiouridine biosynthesis bifunctional protein
VYIGDALSLRTLGPGRDEFAGFDFVWQDPFSPQKNPTMWSAEWFARVREVSATGCTLMTYSVARAVRDALAASGWSVAKIPTSIRMKRHWLRATPSGA